MKKKLFHLITIFFFPIQGSQNKMNGLEQQELLIRATVQKTVLSKSLMYLLLNVPQFSNMKSQRQEESQFQRKQLDQKIKAQLKKNRATNSKKVCHRPVFKINS